ncbi:MAG: TIGR00725 family protein [Pseudomonadota bacterium]
MTGSTSEGPQGRRPIAAVVGAACVSAEGERVAEMLGKCIIDAGFCLVTGGLGGVMRAASRGAHASARHTSGDVIGVLPSYDASTANAWVDIPICTGLDHARNLVVVATGDVVFALGGKAGTLSEIALAWALGKPVIAVGDEPGWASTLAGQPIDDRRDDRVHGPLDPEAAVALALDLLRQPRSSPRGIR